MLVEHLRAAFKKASGSGSFIEPTRTVTGFAPPVNGSRWIVSPAERVCPAMWRWHWPVTVTALAIVSR